MKMKKKAGAKTAKKAVATKKPATKPAAAKKPPTKPTAPKKAPAKPVASPSSVPAAAEAKKRPGTYTPPAVEGTGWAPFRYPPQ